MAKWSRPPAASLIAFSSLSPFITHNFIKIPPHLSLSLSPPFSFPLSLSLASPQSPCLCFLTRLLRIGQASLPPLWCISFSSLPPSVPPSSACCSRLFFWELCCCFSCILSHFLCFSLSLRWHAIRHCYRASHSLVHSLRFNHTLEKYYIWVKARVWNLSCFTWERKNQRTLWTFKTWAVSVLVVIQLLCSLNVFEIKTLLLFDIKEFCWWVINSSNDPL